MLNLGPKTDKIKKSLNTYKFLMMYGCSCKVEHWKLLSKKEIC